MCSQWARRARIVARVPSSSLVQSLERLFEERLSPQVGTDRRGQDAAVPERRPREQLAAPEAAGGVRRLGEPLVPEGVLSGPVVRARQVKEQLAAERLVLGAEAIEQLERPPEVAHRDLGRDLLQRAPPGLVAVPHRLAAAEPLFAAAPKWCASSAAATPGRHSSVSPIR